MSKRLKEYFGEERLISICTSNFYVLKATFRYFKEKDKNFLIESTSNQVNPYGGYTGLKPIDFVSKIRQISKEVGFDKYFIGTDHAGTYPWRKGDKESAMKKAKELIRESVKSGYFKIHLDTSYPLKGEETLSLKEIIEREMELCMVAEEEAKDLERKPVYVIGTDVPRPGGDVWKKSKVTPKEELIEMLQEFKKALNDKNMESTWERVIAVVVQLGTEFGDKDISDYNSQKVKEIKEVMDDYPYLTLEAHSTDYQKISALKDMVRDGVGIFKVGPALTYAYRSALFSLSFIEDILFPENKSNFRKMLSEVLKEDNTYWKDYYAENISTDIIIYSFLDRWRYYHEKEKIQESIKILFKNFSDIEIPLPLIYDFFP